MDIIINCHPTYGGSGIVATELAIVLAKKNHRVHIVSHDSPVRLNFFHPNLFFHKVQVNSYPLFRYPSYGLALANTIVDIINRHQIDIIHVHYAIPHATSAWLAKQILGDHAKWIPLITTLHGTDITVVGNDPSYFKIVEFSINSSDGVTTVSNALKQITFDQFKLKQNIEVIPNFIDINQFSVKNRINRKQEDKKVITHVSNFRPVKQVEKVIEIFCKILDRYPDSILNMVGDGPKRSTAEKITDKLKIKDHVHFFGELDLDSVISVLKRTDVFLLPSEFESFGVAALEAMSCGVPVICFNVGGLSELIEHKISGFLCEKDNIEEMTKHTLELLSNDQLYNFIKKNAIKRAHNFSSSKVVTQYEDFYIKIINKMKNTFK